MPINVCALRVVYSKPKYAMDGCAESEPALIQNEKSRKIPN